MSPARLLGVLPVLLAAVACERTPARREPKHETEALTVEPSPPPAGVLPAAGAPPPAAEEGAVEHAAEPVAVVELFTSEGCSSCPRADAVLAALTEDAERSGRSVITLELHVDYWDDLGWADPFSSAAYSERQRAYATRLMLRELYTPQAVVNGRWQLVGSQEKSLDVALARALAAPAPLRVVASAHPGSGPGDVRVSYEVAGPGAARSELTVVLVQDRAETQVERGENRARTLHHRHIVRALRTRRLDGEPRGAVSLAWPGGAVPADAFVVALASDAESGAILGAGVARP